MTATATEPVSQLGLTIGPTRWLVALPDAGEILPVPEAIVPVPLARDWLLGLVNLRGALYTVVDLMRFTQVGATPMGRSARLLVPAARVGVNAAIVVSGTLGLCDLTSMREDDDPPIDGDGAWRGARPAWVGPARIDAEGRRWHPLELRRLAVDETFLRIGR